LIRKEPVLGFSNIVLTNLEYQRAILMVVSGQVSRATNGPIHLMAKKMKKFELL